ncbi:hypothetical protein QFC21_000540 [Naganishia friedmannii]|uniref:Uncharacterized protein n=1 Tax=Naganishia friedmannii TaxID=89922 RepID=A0ACC2WEC6_9TREE|nr:hypothetical protein QFC21_000540 [Naganishia friedmannii]
MIPLLAYGTAIMKPSDNDVFEKDISKEVNLALSEAHFRHLDCAEGYTNELSVGSALRDSRFKRKHIFVATKCELGLSETWTLMEELQREGKTKSLGVSNCRIDDIEEILKNSKITPVVNQIEIQPYVFDTAKPIIDYCHSKGIAIAGYATLAPLTHFPGGPVCPVIKKRIAEELNATEDQVLLKWAHQVTYGGVVVVSSRKKVRMQGFTKALTEMKNLAESQIKAISEAGLKKHQRAYGTRMDEGPSL